MYIVTTLNKNDGVHTPMAASDYEKVLTIIRNMPDVETIIRVEEIHESGATHEIPTESVVLDAFPDLPRQIANQIRDFL